MFLASYGGGNVLPGIGLGGVHHLSLSFTSKKRLQYSRWTFVDKPVPRVAMPLGIGFVKEDDFGS